MENWIIRCYSRTEWYETVEHVSSVCILMTQSLMAGLEIFVNQIG